MENLIDKYKDRLPDSYLEFISKNQEFEGDLGDELGYVVLWDVNLLSQIFELICEHHDNIGRDYFPIGSDGGGENICIKLTASSKELFYIHSISTSDKDAIFFCDSFDKLYNAVEKFSESNNLSL
jgi:hypothetical protein